jgi:hypothetical protein
MKLAAKGVGFHADTDQVVGVEEVEGLGFGEGHVQVNSNGGRGIGPNAGIKILHRLNNEGGYKKPLTAKVAKEGREGREEKPLGYLFL